jgi:hydrogenase expression/formation protein HypD
MIDFAQFSDPSLAATLVRSLQSLASRPWRLMEVCGGQTHAIIRHGLDQLLPENIELIHGPGCPVCVTPATTIDAAIALAQLPEIILCTFGDMLRVPGTETDLQRVKATGADVRMLYSPLDALQIAADNPQREVVFFAIGFETTAPIHAQTILHAERRRLTNFSLLTALVRVPPALNALLVDPATKVDAILAAGHVCTVMGASEYDTIAARYHTPIVITGFEPIDLLWGIHQAVQQLELGQARVENAFARTAPREGNPLAQRAINRVLQETDCSWRGLGVIPNSGWRIRDQYSQFDAEQRFRVELTAVIRSKQCQLGSPAWQLPILPTCRSGEVLRGTLKPYDCAAFAVHCTPSHPLGATMVSDEGACAAYFHAGRTAPSGQH